MNTEASRPTMADYVREHGITAKTQYLGKIPKEDGAAKKDQWLEDHRLFYVTLCYDGRFVGTEYKCNPYIHWLGPWRTLTAATETTRERRVPRIDRRKLFGRDLDTRLPYKGRGCYGGRSVDEAHNDPRWIEICAETIQFKAEDVLDCLIIDASGTDQRFEDWAVDLGYDPDSRSAERIFHACRDVAVKLRIFLGSAAELERLQTDYDRL